MDAEQASGSLPQVQDVCALLHDLYASAADDIGFGRFLARTCSMLDASLASISLSDRETGGWHQVDQFPADAEMVAYETYYSNDDPIKAELLRRAPHRFYTALDLATVLAPDARARWHRWFSGIGYCDGATAHFPIDEHYSCVFAVVRGSTAPAFTQADTALLDLLLPHIAQTLSIHANIGRLRIMADIAQEQFAQLVAGCITLNEDRRINFINSVAREVLRAANGLLLHDGTLRLSNADADVRFQQLLKTCITTSRLPTVMSGNVLAAPRPGRLPLNLVVVPYRSNTRSHTAIMQPSHVIVVIFDPERPRVTPTSVLRELYALSESEATVCWRIANGESIDEIAAAEQLSKETVRSQLKRVFAKTGTKRQAELMRLVLIGPAAIGGVPADHSSAPQALAHVLTRLGQL